MSAKVSEFGDLPGCVTHWPLSPGEALMCCDFCLCRKEGKSARKGFSFSPAEGGGSICVKLISIKGAFSEAVNTSHMKMCILFDCLSNGTG